MPLAPSPSSPQEIAPAPSAAPVPGWLERRSTHLAAVLLSALVLYAPTLRGTFDFDTPPLLLDNPAVHGLSLAHLRAVFTGIPNGVEYLPVRDLTYMLDFDVWGLNALGFHLSNVLFYAACCATLYLLLERLLARWTDRARLLAAAATLLFVFHPVHVESVAGIAQRKDVVSGLLCLASLLAFDRWLARRGWGAYALSVAALALAMLAKASAVVVPGLALLWALPQRWRERRVLLGLAGLGAAGVALGAAASDAAKQVGILWESDASPWVRLLDYGFTAVWYVRKLLVPWPLNHLYDVRPVSGALDRGAVLALAAVAAASAAALVWGRRWPVPAFSLGWFLVAIVPVSGLAAAPNLVADRYLFLPSVGFCLAVAWLLVEGIGRRSRALAAAGMGAVLLAYGVAIVARLPDWRTNGGLLEADLRTNPGSARLAGVLGRYHYANRRYAEAFAMFERARALDPGSLDGPFFAALYRLQAGDPAGALAVLGALRDAPVVDVQCVVGMALEALGRTDEARAAYARALGANRVMGVLFTTTAEAALARLGGR